MIQVIEFPSVRYEFCIELKLFAVRIWWTWGFLCDVCGFTWCLQVL